MDLDIENRLSPEGIVRFIFPIAGLREQYADEFMNDKF
jgi:hypothetical protein